MKKILSNKLWVSVLVSDLISNFGDVVFYLALMNYVLLLPDTKYAISIITLSEMVPPLFSVVIGYIADKSKNKVNHIILTQLFRVVLYGIVGLLLGLTPSLLVVMIISILNFFSDFAGGYENLLYVPLSVEIVSNELREQASAFKQTVSQITRVIFQSVSAILVVVISYQNLAFINAGTFLISALIMIILSKQLKQLLKKSDDAAVELKNSDIEYEQDNYEKQSFMQSFISSGKDTFTALKQDKELLVLIGVSPLINAIFSILPALVMLKITEDNHFIIIDGATTIALNSIIATVFAIVGSFLSMTVLKKYSLNFIVNSIYLFCCLIFISIIFSNIYLFLVGFSMIITFSSALQPKLNARVINSLPKEMLSMLIGFLGSYTQSGMLLMGILFSIGVTFLSATAISIICLILWIMVVLFNLYQMRKAHN